jgi:hypothetical protein
MYSFNFITSGITKSTDQKVKEGFALTIASLIYYIYFSVCLFYFNRIIFKSLNLIDFFREFYVYFISSSRFRQTVKERILWWQGRNQLYPHNT